MEASTSEWFTTERETASGAVESRQWTTLEREVVTTDEAGARELGRLYLEEVARFSHGLVRPRARRNDVLLVLGGILPLLRFGPPEVTVDGNTVQCRYPIRGGLLVARPGGSLAVSQRGTLELELLVGGYMPRLGGGMRRRSPRRALYTAVHARAHRAVGRRFFERAAGGAT